VAESKISQYPFSLKNKEKLASARVRSLIEATDLLFGPERYEVTLAAEILRRLTAGAKNVASAEEWAETIRLDNVAKFLASLSQCEEDQLKKTVKTGLRNLGLDRRLPGRPKGRNQEAFYATYVELVAAAIKATGVYAKKQEMKDQFGDDWRRHFERFLRRENWPLHALPLVSASSSPEKLAEQIVANECRVSPDRIYRAVRASKSVKK
jgi:predicted DNA-binding protein